MLVQFKKSSILFVSLVVSFQAKEAFSLKQTLSPKQKITQYVSNPAELKASLVLETNEKRILLYPKIEQLEKRIRNFEKDARVDPVVLTFEDQEKSLEELVSRLARKGQDENLKIQLEKEAIAANKEDAKSSKLKVDIKPKMLSWINLDELVNFFEREHLDVNISTDSRSSFVQENLRRLNEQASFFLDPMQIRKLGSKIRSQETVVLADDLLPTFPKKMLEKFSVYRGPNCFHASLAFHDLQFGQNPFVNIRKEAGYHDYMINHDELAYAIQAYFYEVNTQKEPLKFGDMMVFYDVEDPARPSPHFKWIKHASTYLLGEYVFSKGSKQADTPYSVKTISDEWKVWKKYTKNLGVKVFRRSQKSVTKRPPIFLDEWLY